MNKKIGHFRLSNGDEIISSYTKTKTGYKLYEPAVVDEAMFNGQSSIVLARYLLSEDNTALLSANHVMTFSNVNVVVRNYYLWLPKTPRRELPPIWCWPLTSSLYCRGPVRR